MNVYATQHNYDKITEGYATKTCSCQNLGLCCVMRHDPQKLWRCNVCFAPILHPISDTAGPTTDIYPPPYTNITEPRLPNGKPTNPTS